MVEHTTQLDLIFGSLASSVRRDILKRAARKERSIGDIAKRYNMTFAGISKHLKVLEKAKLIRKRRQGKEYLVKIEPKTLSDATSYLRQYERLWNDRLDSLERYLSSFPSSPYGKRRT